jgi:putative membrane protein
MIDRYADHAANERTFLAWVRTGIATIAFGFVVEKFNLFVLTIAEANSIDAARRAQFEKFSGSFSHYDGLALILVGIGIIAVSLVRFVRTTRLIDDQQAHSASSVRPELSSIHRTGSDRGDVDRASGVCMITRAREHWGHS